ncbi:hypothetical protein FDW88_10515 [Citrobacter sp. wls829]|nr:hypothetical protein FDW88_10515 [Citrobacter sp. wls829]
MYQPLLLDACAMKKTCTIILVSIELATINGRLYGHHTTDVSRNIYFSYTQQRDARVLQTTLVVKTFADTADEDDINSTLPGFYRQSGRGLSLVMEEYKGAWIFATSNVPSLYCRKR